MRRKPTIIPFRMPETPEEGDEEAEGAGGPSIKEIVVKRGVAASFKRRKVRRLVIESD